MGTIFLAAGALTLAALAAAIIYGLLRAEHRGQIASFLLEASTKDGEPGKPSISRLQMLIWNFVVAFAFLYVLGNLGLEEALSLVDPATAGGDAGTIKLAAALKALFSPEILILLGISNGTYLLGKMTPQASAQPEAPAENGADGGATGGPAPAAASRRASDAVRSVGTQPGAGTTGPLG